MAISPSDFAEALRSLRPRLVHGIRQLLRCSPDDAEDIISDAIAAALARLGDVDPAAGHAGLKQWLFAIARQVGRARSREQAARPATASMADPGLASTPDPRTCDRRVPAVMETLHPDVQLVVEDWLMGYRIDEIARRLRIHRNTVKARLRWAAEALQAEFPDVDSWECAVALFTFCSQVTVYRKPRAVWKPWRDRHPAEPRIKRPAARS